MQENEENQSAERRIIPWMDGELEVEQKENRGWEGILYRRLDIYRSGLHCLVHGG